MTVNKEYIANYLQSLVSNLRFLAHQINVPDNLRASFEDVEARLKVIKEKLCAVDDKKTLEDK